MKIIFTLIISLLFINSYAQEKNFIDQPYLETSGKADTLVTPDRIFITIILNEADSKNKKSTEELEKTLEQALKKLNINTEKQLTLLDYSSDFKNAFLKSQNILKTKNYSLMLYDAVTANKVIAALEEEGISNVSMNRTEYSKSEELLAKLRSLAIQKAKTNAQQLLAPLGQKLGKAIFISNLNLASGDLQGKLPGVQIRGASGLYGSRAVEPIFVEIQKIRFEEQVVVKFIIE